MPRVEQLAERFPQLPAGVVLKLDLLRQGVRADVAPVGSRHYHHHDERGQKPATPEHEHFQGSIQLPDGPHVFVAHNAASPYSLRRDGAGRLLLAHGGEIVCEVSAGPRFRWTTQRTGRGTPMATLFSPSLGGACGPLAIFLLRHCEFAVAGDECRFCSWVRMGKSSEMRPDAADMREALEAIHAEQGGAGYLAFSGGSLFDRAKEADAFLAYMRAARQASPELPPTVAAIQALEPSDSARLRDAGFDYVCYSMEVWHEELWPEVVPGKTRSVGRARWMRCLEEAVGLFGAGRVLCNFVAGVETAVPGVFRSPEEAADSTLEGMRWCCERGIYPKYAVWIVAGGARFGGRAPAPLEYLVRLVEGRQHLYEEFGIPVPRTDCAGCLTQSCEADLALLDPAAFARGPAGEHPWRDAHARRAS
jgi:hypothetical protein